MSQPLGSEARKVNCGFETFRLHKQGYITCQKSRLCRPRLVGSEGRRRYTDWVIVGLHGLREYFGHPYRQLLDVLSEMPGIVAKFDLKVAELPDFTTVYTRKQEL